MATRASIIFKSNNDDDTIIMYHHWDGYYSYLGVKLEKYIKKYKHIKKPSKLCKIINKDDDSFEYSDNIHGDIAYLYVVNLINKTISVFDYNFNLIKDVKVI